MSTPNPECPGCQALLAQLQELQTTLTTLQAQVAELTARVNQNPTNSSRPPSSQHPHAPKPPSAPPPSGRKRGGQKGHPGTTRALAHEAALREVVPCVPTVCSHCQGALPTTAAADTPPPLRHQVFELPPIELEITEYQRHARTCPDCGKRTWGALPPGAPRGILGPRLQAAAALCTGAYRLSRPLTRELLRQFFGLEVAVSTLSQAEAETSAALAAPYAEVAQAVAASPVVNTDETPWREGKQRPWLWVAVTKHGVLYRLDDHRDTAAFEALLPPRGARILGSDRYSVYTRLDPQGHAVCWAHLQRDFQGRLEAGGKGAAVARWALEEIGKLFSHWHAFRRGERERATLWEQLRPVQRAFRTLLSWGQSCGCKKTAALCRNLEARWEALWTFAVVEGVEPTNNAAERALRPAVIWRKISLGTQSERGRRFVERLLTVGATVKQQGGNLLEFLVTALEAARHGQPAPPLLAGSPA